MFMECQVIHIKMSPTNGATTGPHLHLGVRYNDEYINPLSLFN